MKKSVIIMIVIVLAAIILLSLLFNKKEDTTETNMELTSNAFNNGGEIPSKYTCDGQDINPQLEITNIPKNAQTLVLIIDDPDAPAKVWVHWLVWNIPANTQIISENTVPSGAMQGVNDFKENKYGGPCPPSGTHTYKFKLYALDTSLNLPETSTKQDVESAMQNHIIEQTELKGTYSR